MSQTVLIKKSTIPGKTPNTLTEGELAVNLSDLLLFVGTANGVRTFPMSGGGSAGTIDGGSASSTYLQVQTIDGGGANG